MIYQGELCQDSALVHYIHCLCFGGLGPYSAGRLDAELQAVAIDQKIPGPHLVQFPSSSECTLFGSYQSTGRAARIVRPTGRSNSDEGVEEGDERLNGVDFFHGFYDLQRSAGAEPLPFIAKQLEVPMNHLEKSAELSKKQRSHHPDRRLCWICSLPQSFPFAPSRTKPLEPASWHKPNGPPGPHTPPTSPGSFGNPPSRLRRMDVLHAAEDLIEKELAVVILEERRRKDQVRGEFRSKRRLQL